MKHGARNDIPAEVVDIKTGSIMAQVTVKLMGTDNHMTPVMTSDSLHELGIEKGTTVHVVAKAVNAALRPYPYTVLFAPSSESWHAITLVHRH